MFILKNITDVIDFVKERATAHPREENKHLSEINEDAQVEQRNNLELNNVETFPSKANLFPRTKIKTQNLGVLCKIVKVNLTSKKVFLREQLKSRDKNWNRSSTSTKGSMPTRNRNKLLYDRSDSSVNITSKTTSGNSQSKQNVVKKKTYIIGGTIVKHIKR